MFIQLFIFILPNILPHPLQSLSRSLHCQNRRENLCICLHWSVTTALGPVFLLLATFYRSQNPHMIVNLFVFYQLGCNKNQNCQKQMTESFQIPTSPLQLSSWVLNLIHPHWHFEFLKSLVINGPNLAFKKNTSMKYLHLFPQKLSKGVALSLA